MEVVLRWIRGRSVTPAEGTCTRSFNRTLTGIESGSFCGAKSVSFTDSIPRPGKSNSTRYVFSAELMPRTYPGKIQPPGLPRLGRPLRLPEVVAELR